jgi:hypothetical protein
MDASLTRFGLKLESHKPDDTGGAGQETELAFFLSWGTCF